MICGVFGRKARKGKGKAMAELRQLWPKLKKKLSPGGSGEGGKKNRIYGNANTNKKKKSSKQPNPYSTHGLDKLAVVVAELQAKKTSLVDHTGNSVAAARSLSRSAQEWTATTLARTASRGRRSNNTPKETSTSPSPSFSRSSELLLLQCSPQSSVGNTELIDFSHSFSFAPSSDEATIVGELSADDDDVGLGRDEMADDEIAAMAERRSDPQEVGCSGSSGVIGIASLPLKGSICLNKKGRGLKGKGWRAMAVLVALGAYIASHTANFVNPLAAAMSFSVVIRRWHKGKMYAKFVFFQYFLTPLQTYITAHSPRRVLAILPARRVEVDVEKEEAADVDSQLSSRGFELHPKSETTDEVATTTHVRNPSFVFPVLPLGSMPPSPMRLAAPSSMLAPSISAPATLASLLATTEDEITPAAVEVGVTSLPGFRSFPLSPASSMEREGASPTRRLARKILLKLKPRKSSKASSSVDVARGEDDALSSTAESPLMSLQSGATTSFSGSEPSSPMFSPSPSPSSSPSRVSSPERHHRKFPFSRKAKGKSLLANNNNNDASSSADGGEQNHTTEQKHPKALERRSSGNKRCILRRDKGSVDHGHGRGGSNGCRKSVLCRMASGDSIDYVPTTSQAPAGPELRSSLQPDAAEEAKEKNVEVWPMVGLLVTLLFLIVGKFPAIVATSCFFIVLSTRDKSHHRPLGRGTRRPLEAARKLNRSPPPRAGIRVTPPGSPARDEHRKWAY